VAPHTTSDLDRYWACIRNPALALEPEPDDLIRAIDTWVGSLQFWQIVRKTDAPTWAQLQEMKIYPAHRDGEP
jgi:hypothetical protein